MSTKNRVNPRDFFSFRFAEKTGSVYVCVFQANFERVFRGQKICLRYFKIGQTYFELRALCFFFAPMWV